MYKIKYKADGQVERFKARLVAKGYNQKEGLDYHETFSPVVKMVTVRTVLSVAAAKGWNVQQMDVYNAFLQGDLMEEVYMQLPQGFQADEKRKGQGPVCKLIKSLYGLEQASRQWNVKLTNALIEAGFQQSHLDYSLMTKKVGNDIVVVLIYVDDLLVTGSSCQLIEETKQVLKDHFRIKDLGDLRFFLGIEFARNSEGILMHQRKYALELISDLGLGSSKPMSTPAELNLKLTTPEFDDLVGDTSDSLLLDPGEYQRLVGRLLYLTLTRPDISYAVQSLSQFMQAPKVSHMNAAIRVVKYVKQSPGFGILLTTQSTESLQAYCDDDWGSCANSRRSITGYLIKYGDSPISWKSKKQSTISGSSAEAEYTSLASTIVEITWIIGLFKTLVIAL